MTRRRLLLLALAQILSSTAVGLCITIASVTALELSGTEAVAGLAQTSMVVGATLLTLPVSWIAARRGRRASLVFAFGAAAVGSAVSLAGVIAGSWPVLLLGMIGIGAGSVAGLAIRFAAADGVSGASVPRAIGFVMWASTVGAIVGPNAVAPIARVLGFEPPVAVFAVLVGLFVLGALMLAFFVPDVVPPEGHGQKGPGIRAQFGLLWSRPDARRALWLAMMSHAAMVGLMAMAPVHLHHMDEPLSVVGLIISLHMVSMYILSPLFGSLVARLGAARVGMLGLLTNIAGAVILALAPTGNALVFGMGLSVIGFGWSMGMISASTIVTLTVPAENKTSAQGVLDLGVNLAGGLGSVLAGAVVAGWGYPTLAYIVLGLAVFVLVVIAPLLRSDRAGVSRAAARVNA